MEIECPICSNKFGKDKIEKHVDTCLRFPVEKPLTRRAISSSPDTRSFFEKKAKRKRSVKSPEAVKDKKQCLANLNDKSLSVVEIVDTPPIPRLSIDSEAVCNGNASVDNPVENNVKSQITRRDISVNDPSPKNSFQETLLKWSQQKTDSGVKETKNEYYSCSQQTISLSVKEKKTENASCSNLKVEPKELELDVKEIDLTHIKSEQSTIKLVLGKIPLAEQMRPTTFDDYFGQEAVNSNKLLKDLFHNQRIPSLLLWGPPGCGKTSLAHIIAQRCKVGPKYRFVKLSATMSGVNDVKEAVKVAKNEKRLTKRQTVLFIDEVHRFNKMQQDTFLPHVEDGTIVLIGATTENPSFHLNNALLSRCKLVVLTQLAVENIVRILTNAVERLDGFEQKEDEKENETDHFKSRFVLQAGVLKSIADYANGDARVALNTLDLILQAKIPVKVEDQDCPSFITIEEFKEEMKRGYVNYDRNGDEHYDIVSALHKSIRGGDENAAVYWLARMLEGGETPLYIARRLVRIASEDIGLADPHALNQAVAAYQACHFLGMPECDVILAQAATYLARASKSIEVLEAYGKAKQLVRTWTGTQPSVPLHLRNAPTRMMKNLGYGVGYKYTPKCTDDPGQDYLPPELRNKVFFDG